MKKKHFNIRKDLEELHDAQNLLNDESRKETYERKNINSNLSAANKIKLLCDENSYMEYGAFTIAAQTRRRSLEDLRKNTPRDGLVCGFGNINSSFVHDSDTRCAVFAYDYSVLAGTQGHNSHKKKDRLFALIKKIQCPTVFFTEGGGGRPGDIDTHEVINSWLDLKTFTNWAQLSGKAPRIAINSGKCFAGNAVIFGCADITIACVNSNVGLAGPAMIAGGGLGDYKSSQIGTFNEQILNGVIDIPCDSEIESIEICKKILSIFQGNLKTFQIYDQEKLNHIIPEDRKRPYNIRQVIEIISDRDAVIEIRENYGRGLITAFIRIKGIPFGLIANNPKHLGGAIDDIAGEKGARFLQMCDVYGIPIISLCDTPGFMVGPESERKAAVRKGSRLLLVSSNIKVPIFSIILRKGYGLGAQAMTGGGFHQSFFTICWPSAEMGPMGFEGAVKLGFSKELANANSDLERKKLYNLLVKKMYKKGKALSVASTFEVDDVIEPKFSRDWIINGLKTYGKVKKRKGYADIW